MNKDLLSLIGLKLNLKNLLTFSLINKKTYNATVNCNNFWRRKIYVDTGLKLTGDGMKKKYKYYLLIPHSIIRKAVRDNNLEAIKLSIEKGVTFRDLKWGFVEACFEGNLELIKYLTSNTQYLAYYEGKAIAQKMGYYHIVEYINTLINTCPIGDVGVMGTTIPPQNYGYFPNN